MKYYLLLAAFYCCCFNIQAVCPGGQVEVFINVHTDDYGGEGYWQLVPTGNACGTGTIFSGGNTNVGCNGGGQQNSPAGGYGNNMLINAGPWCLALGDTFDIIFVDDYADGGMRFDIIINGFPVYAGLTGSGDAPGTRFTFVATPPPASDVSCLKVTNTIYVNFGNVIVTGLIKNTGSDTVHSVDLHYTIDSGPVQTTTIPGLNIAPFNTDKISHTLPWNINVAGEYDITLWTNNPNGNVDANSANDSAVKRVTAGPGIPNIIDDYIGITPVLTVIANSSDSISVPRDLDFHPILSRYELWVILKSTEAIGGKTVKLTEAGQSGQSSLLQKDGNAWHFMSLPTGIAFSENGNFATSPGVYDANHDGGNPFTGPTLWSSDPLIYAQPSGGNGSHLDMLHQSPYAMGICAEEENVFWVFDDNDQDIVRYDFQNDHGPGNSDHSDAIVRRFAGLNVAGDPAHHVPSHLVLDKGPGMLYIVDTGNDRILKMDIHTGTFSANLAPYESMVEYSEWTGAVHSVFADSGLITPSGIDIIDNRVVVSDYATGDIIIYDNSGTTGVEVGRIVTGTPGIMGIKIGPDGKVWYVNATTNEVVRIDGLPTGINEHVANNFSVYPNPVSSKLHVLLNSNVNVESNLNVFDCRGKLVINKIISKGEREISFDVTGLSSGVYTISFLNTENVVVKKFVKQ